MIHAVFRYDAVIVATLCLFGCSGASSNQSASDQSPTASENEFAPEATPGSGDTGTTVSGTDDSISPDADTGVDSPVSCDGKTCLKGQSCIEYVGVTGRPLYTCGIPCKENAPNDGCPETMQCHVIPDGPTQCVKR